MSDRPLDDILGDDWERGRREIEPTTSGLKELTKQEMLDFLAIPRTPVIAEREMREAARRRLDEMRALARHRYAPRD